LIEKVDHNIGYLMQLAWTWSGSLQTWKEILCRKYTT